MTVALLQLFGSGLSFVLAGTALDYRGLRLTNCWLEDYK